MSSELNSSQNIPVDKQLAGTRIIEAKYEKKNNIISESVRTNNQDDTKMPTDGTKHQIEFADECVQTSVNKGCLQGLMQENLPSGYFVGFDALRKNYEMNVLSENRNRISVLTETIRQSQTTDCGDSNLRQISSKEHQSVDAVLKRWNDLDTKMIDCLNKDALQQKTIMELTRQNEKLKQIINTVSEYLQNATPTLQQSVDFNSRRDTVSEATTSNTSNFRVEKRRNRKKRKAESNSHIEIVDKKSRSNASVSTTLKDGFSSVHFIPRSRLCTVHDSKLENGRYGSEKGSQSNGTSAEPNKNASLVAVDNTVDESVNLIK